ncbi:hypothetical protein Lesp02_85010 [Lentzea sp. NBRC 105346]|uniref:MFS transporter n=1 Tax=Lentzea sp. NBRC 105346 TaxID=3032205 RepID=UPI0024A43D4A|nr:MFS transporter [Lentzea sp. NBRC 105346]GLZ36314.1 hypothetical protein Lesp02_85010 [Lentzea sp. NBRC 105346]
MTLSTETAYRYRWPALFTLVLAQVMDLFDGVVTNVAAPAIRGGLGGDLAQLQWISAAYTLTFAVGLITGGRLGDIWGRRRILLIGVAGFALSSLACGLAQDPATLIAARAVQGAFAAVMIPQQFGLIKQMFSPREMPKAFGVLGPVVGLTTISAPIIGGALVDAWGWQSVFLVNIPIGALLIAGVLRWVPESRSPSALKPDYAGMILVSAGVLLLIHPLVQGREDGWPAWVFVELAAAVPVLLVFAWHQTRKASPLVPPRLFKERSYTGGLLLSLVFYAGLNGTMLVVVLHMQLVEHMTPLQAGLVLVPWSLGASIGSTVSGMWLAARYGRKMLHAGIASMAVGMAWFATTDTHVVPLFVAGVGMGLLLAPFLDIVLWGVDKENVGAASGVLNATQQLANALGVAVLGTIFFDTELNTVLWTEVGLLATGFLLTFLLPQKRPDVR